MTETEIRTNGADPAPTPTADHDAAMDALVRPADWHNPEPAGKYNLVVIGGGTAGLVSAMGAAGLGAKVALVERDRLGGDCLVHGCVPSKALLAAGRAAAAARRAGNYGVATGPVSVDFSEVMTRMRRLRASISHHDSAKRFRDAGVDVFLGEARFIGKDRVVVDGKTTLRFARAVIATGARAARLPIPGLEEVGYLTNETVFSLNTLPRRLAVIGAGPIGCELAQAFARFGSEVHLVEAMDRIMPREDPDASRIVAGALKADGVKIATGAKIAGIEKRGDEKVIRLEGEDPIVADAILVGVGRAPNVEGLGLEDAGVAYEKTGVTVDERLRTTNRRIYAAGDVASGLKFTHLADAQARIVLRNALFFGRAKASALTVPWCTYTDPEVAHVGLTPEEAEQRGIAIHTFVQPMAEVDRAVLEGGTDGFAKVHVKAGTDRIVGATIVDDHAGELLAPVTTAMVHGIGLGGLAQVIQPYPVRVDALRRLGDAYARTRLTPRVAAIFAAWLKWLRR